MATSHRKRTAIMILAAGVVCITIGAYRGEIAVVLHNAIVVCLECIGIG